MKVISCIIAVGFISWPRTNYTTIHMFGVCTIFFFFFYVFEVVELNVCNNVKVFTFQSRSFDQIIAVLSFL